MLVRPVGSLALLLLTAVPATTAPGFTDTLLVATGTANDLDFGWWSACAGDLNGDGLDDVAIYGHDYSTTQNHVAVYFTGPSADGVADIEFSGQSAFGFGWYMNGVGDMNGDGMDDFVITAHTYPAGVIDDRGRAYLYWGRASWPSSLDGASANVKIDGEDLPDLFGYDVRPLGDLNRDGLDDMVITAPRARGYGVGYVFFGDPSLTGTISASTADLVVEGWGSPDLGGNVTVGDFDGDTVPDLAIYGNTGVLTRVFLGDSTATGNIPDSLANVVITGATWVSSGDVNGDGYDDLLTHDATVSAAYLFVGGPSLPAEMTLADADVTIQPEIPGEALWATIVPDWDGDGDDEMLVSAPDHDGAYTDAGCVYLLYGGPALPSVLSVAEAKVIADGPGDATYFGYFISMWGIPEVLPGRSGVLVGSEPNTVYLFIPDSTVVAANEPHIAPSERPSLFASPNPFRAGTEVSYRLPRGTPVHLAVYDTAGRLVRRLTEGWVSSGNQRITWDGSNDAGTPLVTGVYFVRLRAEGQTVTRKAVLLR
jgi:hypothetical protein